MFHWPDLHFGPINLWTAPWLGRQFIQVDPKEPAKTVEPSTCPNPKHEELEALLKRR